MMRATYQGPRRRTRLRITSRGLAVLNLGLAVLLLAMVGGIAYAMASAASDPLPPCTDWIAEHGGVCSGPLLPPCPTEDSDGCYWDGDTMGNGRGSDMVTP